MEHSQTPAHLSPRLLLHGTRSLHDTLYWIEEAMQQHIREFKAQPDVLVELAERSYTPIDLIARLEQLLQNARQLDRDIGRAIRGVKWHRSDDPEFADLPGEQAAELARINRELDQVGHRIETFARSASDMVTESLADHLLDRELSVNVDFSLHDGDPAFSTDSDNFVARLEDFTRFTEQWPDGYSDGFPMPHGGLMHGLRLYGGGSRGLVDYRTIQRIGRVWVDVVVTYQYMYDLRAGRWVTSGAWNGDAPGATPG